MDRRRLLLYLLLNVFVSACVTSAILYWYDRNYRAVSLPQLSVPAAATSDGNSTPVATVQKGMVQIVSVVGAGTLGAEAVIVKYNGPGQLDLTGWQLKEPKGSSTYTFPSFKLFTGGAVQVHTQAGTNTAIDLYWGQNQAVWRSGDAVLLTDPSGQAQDSYPVP
jgi:hypothetical protein